MSNTQTPGEKNVSLVTNYHASGSLWN